MNIAKAVISVSWVIAAACAGTSPSETQRSDRAGATVGIRGVLKSESGDLLRDTTVMGCMTTSCLFAESDRDGSFEFLIEPPASVVVKTQEDLSRKPRLGATMRPVRLSEATASVDLGFVFVPEMPEAIPIEAGQEETQTISAGDGLELTLRSADLEPRLGDVLTGISARRVPEKQIPSFPELEGEIIAVYALHPFAAESSSPIGVRFPSKLKSGTKVAFYTVSELDGSLSPAVDGSADDGMVSTEAGTGITELSWLVIARAGKS